MIRPAGPPDGDAPLVVVLGSLDGEPREARLADVLVTTADERCALFLGARLLARNPGSALAVVAGPAGRVTATARDGCSVALSCVWSPGIRSSSELIESVARHLYAHWTTGSPLAELSEARLVISSRGEVELIELPGEVPGSE